MAFMIMQRNSLIFCTHLYFGYLQETLLYATPLSLAYYIIILLYQCTFWNIAVYIIYSPISSLLLRFLLVQDTKNFIFNCLSFLLNPYAFHIGIFRVLFYGSYHCFLNLPIFHDHLKSFACIFTLHRLLNQYHFPVENGLLESTKI